MPGHDRPTARALLKGHGAHQLAFKGSGGIGELWAQRAILTGFTFRAGQVSLCAAGTILRAPLPDPVGERA